MATRFEAVLHGDDPVALRAAGEEAFAEISRLEELLSFYRESSQLTRMNRSAAQGPIRVDPVLFGLLITCRRLHEATDGAFDPAVGPLMRAWGFTGTSPAMPTDDVRRAAHAASGFHRVHLDVGNRTVRFSAPRLEIDLGGIGKGFALDEAATLLREAGVHDGLLHGGTSTVVGLGRDADGTPWKIAVPWPVDDEAPDPAAGMLSEVDVSDRALSVSAVTGKYLDFDGVRYGHVLDARTGRPTRAAMLAAVAAPSATETDALSTALLVLGAAAADLDVFRRKDVAWLVVVSPTEVHARGLSIRPRDSVVCTLHEQDP